MTETRLRTIVSATAYGLATLFFAALAIQNLRYGFYPLFYLAAGISVTCAGGAAYTVTASRHQLRARGHTPAVLLLAALILITAWSQAANTASFWAMPILAMMFLVLPLGTALKIASTLVLLLAVQLLFSAPAGESLPTITALLLVLTGAGVASWHYGHMAQSVEDLAIIDPVTGAHNARFLDETLQKEISRASATNHPVSVLMLGIDNLDQLEGMLGEDQTQSLFRQLAERLFSLVRAGDTVYFLGQGRFCLILPFTPEEGARVTGERLRRGIAETSWPEVGRLTVTIGATTHIEQDKLAEKLRQRASDALDTAAARGHDSVWFSAEPDRAT